MRWDDSNKQFHVAQNMLRELCNEIYRDFGAPEYRSPGNWSIAAMDTKLDAWHNYLERSFNNDY